MPRGSLVVTTHWPSELVLVRHGQSTGNLADDAAREQQAERLDLELRDADVPLSDTGRQQADAVGFVFARLTDDTDGAVVSTKTESSAAPGAASTWPSVSVARV